MLRVSLWLSGFFGLALTPDLPTKQCLAPSYFAELVYVAYFLRGCATDVLTVCQLSKVFDRENEESCSDSCSPFFPSLDSYCFVAEVAEATG